VISGCWTRLRAGYVARSHLAPECVKAEPVLSERPSVIAERLPPRKRRGILLLRGKWTMKDRCLWAVPPNGIPSSVHLPRLENVRVARCSKSNPPMSLVGQTRPFGAFGRMSGVPPRADIRRTSREVRVVPEADSCSAAKYGRSFEQCVGPKQERFWNREADRLCSLQIDGQLKFPGLLYR